MARGGRRFGAGRRKGSLSEKTRVIAERAAAEGITPLEVILRNDALSLGKSIHKRRNL